jgi:hypothetical protein
MGSARLRVAKNLFGDMRHAFTFRLADEAAVHDRCASAVDQRQREVKALIGLTAEEAQTIQEVVSSAAARVERASLDREQVTSRISAFSVPFTAIATAVFSVYILPRVPPYGRLASTLVLLAALLATVAGAVMYIFALPAASRDMELGPISHKRDAILDVLDDWVLFLLVNWIYISVVTTAWGAARSPVKQSWVWELLFAGAIIPFAAALCIALTAVTISILETRRETRQNKYNINDILLLMLLKLATDAQKTVDRWYEPKCRRLLVQRLESDARRIELSFSQAARGIHGTGAAQPVRGYGKKIAAALRRLEQDVALAAGPPHIARVRDRLCSGLLAATQGDWASLSGVDPGSVVNSFLRRLRPRLFNFLFFGSLTLGLLWLSQDENWRSAAIPAATAMGIAAVFAILSPAESVTQRAQEVLDRTFGPLLGS